MLGSKQSKVCKAVKIMLFIYLKTLPTDCNDVNAHKGKPKKTKPKQQKFQISNSICGSCEIDSERIMILT